MSRELDRAAARHPDNPAPLLALARIRRKQGLRTDAQILVERGLQRAIRGEAGVGPGLLAELHYERGTLVKERWLGSWRLGRVSSGALPPSLCPQARSSGGAASGFASVERLIAWNYLCPAELDAILARDFQPTTEGMAEHAVMGASFQRAVEAEPGHVGANVEILLALADEGRWSDVLHGAERFWEISGGHPYADLVGGVALQRLARSDEAYERFERALERLPDERADRLCGVAPLLIDRQAGEYRALSGDERRVWESRFWAALDPIAATQVNERKVEHLARAAYAELRLGGVDTDAGRVWVRYGRPESVRVIGESAVRTEFWDYGGAGPDVTFRRVASSQALALTPEGHAYVDELREAFPHRYGTDARVVTPLEGQVTRFRGDDLGTTHLRIRSRVPDELATGGADALDLGVYVVRGQGRVEERWRSAISAAVAPIELVATAPADARTVTVEVYNRHTGRAASLVAPARLSATDGAPYLSDLMLVRAADPSPRELFWDRAWVAPLDLGRPHEAARLGTLFEVYELPPEVSWYRVRAELRSADSEVRALAIRPAGGTEFRTEWDRRPPAELAGPEYFTVDVADVRPGRYTLRLVLEIPGGGAPLTAERSLELRGS